MKVNDETMKVLERSGLGWLVPLVREKGKEFRVELIGLDVVDIGSRWNYSGDAFYDVLLFNATGQLIARVDEWMIVRVCRWRPTIKHPFRMVSMTKRLNIAQDVTLQPKIENVGIVLKRLGPEAASKVRFVVELPTGHRPNSTDEHLTGVVVIHKLRNSDKDLAARLDEKVKEAAAEIQELLA